MAFIVHVTAVVLIGPTTAIDPRYIAVVMVVVMGVYCLGGFRAVVWTDCLQAGIMFTGALLVLWLISIPTTLPADWPAVSWSLSAFQRITVPWAVISAIVLGVCVRSGDQMAVQRYLATPTVATARKTLILSYAFDIGLTALLCLVGLSLAAWSTGGDGLFPAFIASGLPVGLRGLVVAAMLAAAMSSLSSGIQSCVSTVVVDRRPKKSHYAQDTQRPASVVAGSLGAAIPTIVFCVLILAVSFAIGAVDGNLVERCYKIVNLLSVPLGGLMLTALFRPATTWLTCYVATAVCVGVMVSILYGTNLTFLLAPPAGAAMFAAVVLSERK